MFGFLKHPKQQRAIPPKTFIPPSQPLDPNLEENIRQIQDGMGVPGDLVIHRFYQGNQALAAVVYLRSLTDGPTLGIQVIEPINASIRTQQGNSGLQDARTLLSVAVEVHDSLNSTIQGLLSGQAVLVIDNSAQAQAMSLPGFPRRAVEEPPTERVLRGSREGFTESLQDNLGMIRRGIKDPNLRVEVKPIGERTKTDMAVLYLDE